MKQNYLFTKKIKFLLFAFFIFISNQIVSAQSTILDENPTNAFVGPAASCANNTGGDPTSNTFSYSANTSCYNRADVSVTIIPDNPNPGGDPVFETNVDRVEITLTDDNGATTTTIDGPLFDGGASNTFTATRLNPGACLLYTSDAADD